MSLCRIVLIFALIINGKVAVDTPLTVTPSESHVGTGSSPQASCPTDSCQKTSDPITEQPELQLVPGHDHPLSFTASSVSKVTKPPSIVLLLDLKVIEMVAGVTHDWLAYHLIQDHWKVSKIKQDNPTRDSFYTSIFQEWLRGSGGRTIATWRALIEALRKCELNGLADDISSAVSEKVLDLEPFPYSYSPEVADFIEWTKKRFRRWTIVDSILLRSRDFFENVNFVNLSFSINVSGYPNLRMDEFLHLVNEFKDQNRSLLITGDPGSGKTTLMRYLAKEWAEGKVLQHCQILLLVYLGKCRNSYASLSNLLKDTEYKGHKDIEHIAAVIEGNHGNGTCFLLDAYDEKHVRWDFLKDLLTSESVPDSVCVVTSRPAFASELKRGLHIEIVGFSQKYIKIYVSRLPQRIQSSLNQLWSKHPAVKEACRSPLYLSLIVHIVTSDVSHEELSTQTNVYVGVMNSLITHYHAIDQWNTGDLRECVIEKPPCSDNMLCCAFHTLQRVAFEMAFRIRPDFEVFKMEKSVVHNSIKNLIIVSIHPIGPDKVTYSFAHRTFVEFFAALYLTTLPQERRLFYITKYSQITRYSYITRYSDQYNQVWKFFFGLMNMFYSEDVTTISVALKRYLNHNLYNFLFLVPDRSNCYSHYHMEDAIVLDRRTLETLKELGKTRMAFYLSTVNSAVIVEDYMSISKFDVVLDLVPIHKLCYWGYDNKLDWFTVIIEDWTQKLSKIHLDFIYNIKSNPVTLPSTSLIHKKIFKTFGRRLEVAPFFNQICLSDVYVSRPTELKVLEFNADHMDYRTYKALQGSYTDYWRDTSIIYYMLSSITHIQTIEFHRDFVLNANTRLAGILREPSELHSLTMSFKVCEDIPQFLFGLTNLEYLCILSRSAAGCDDTFLHYLKQNTGLKTLKVRNTKGFKFHKWANILSQFPFLEELHFLCVHLTDIEVP